MVDTTIRNPARVSDLCVDCGLCCSGFLFVYATLPEAEVELARSLGMDVIEIDGAPAFRKPCSCLSGTVCSAYRQQRPQRCATYYCKLAARVDAEEVELVAAKNIVAETRRMLAKIVHYKKNGETDRESILRWYQERRQPDTPTSPIDLIMAAR